jgi:hypothetical protein
MKFKPIITKGLEYYKDGIRAFKCYFGLMLIKGYRIDGLIGILATLKYIILREPLWYELEDKEEDNVK